MAENMAGAPQGENSDVPKQETMKKDVLGLVAQLEAFLDEYMVIKAPFQIPMNGKEILVKIAPYLVIIGAVLFVLSLPALLGLSALTAGLGMMGGGWGYTMLVSLIAGAVSVMLELKALSGLFKRSRASWRLVYYATIVSFAGSVLSFNFIGAIIGGVIGWYILFQVKELYQN